ncbi:MAG: ArsR/SmtB family transcription factor [Nocardioides sp.]
MTGHPAPPASAAPSPPPGHELADRLVLTRADQVRALAHPLRTTILGLLTERAASVAELAEAARRPKSTLAYHVGVLHDAGLLQVVHTRRVRAIEERFYGRAARTITIAVASPGAEPLVDFNDFEVAAGESQPAHEQGRLWAFLRHARINEEQAGEFWERIRDLVAEFDQLPRTGDQTYGLAAGIYPIPSYPQLPDPLDT